MADATPPGPRKRRLFVALPLEEAVRARLAAVAAGELRDGRAVPAANLHVTVVFLGWVAGGLVSELADGLARACAPLAPFELALSRVAPGPPRRPRMLWAHGEPTPAFAALARAVASAAAPFAPGGDLRREPRPHVTLVRYRAPLRRPLPEEHVLDPPGVVRAGTCGLYESHLGGGAVYARLRALPLGVMPDG